MGRADGLTPPQDAGRLPYMPRRHPCRTSHTATTMSTGEPDATATSRARPVRWGVVGKGPVTGTSLATYPTTSTVREEADGKGPEPRAPRRRPTSPLGGGGAAMRRRYPA